MNCEEVKVLSIAGILGDLDPDSEQYHRLESHLTFCQACAEEYKSSEWAIRFIEQHNAVFAEVLRTPEEKKVAEQKEVKRSWERIEARLDELEAQEREEKQAKFRRLLVRLSAAAACLIIGISIFLVFSIYSRPQITRKPASQSVLLAPKPSIRIELVSRNGKIRIPPGQQIASTNELATLVIDGRHRMMMNANTSLSLEPLIEHGNIGCLVKLDSGQIYTQFEHDGNPFVVETTHGKAVITGTVFDIKTSDTTTTLLVSEGSVRFESEEGGLEVKAGYISQIVAGSAPTTPTACDTVELTSWATYHQIETVLEKLDPDSHVSAQDLTDSWLAVTSEPVGLNSIDYEEWVEKKRDWFRGKFPWIFELKEALVKEGIEVDYPELLIQSGDIWQFVYPGASPSRISVVGSASLLKVASLHGFSEQWLFKNVPAAEAAELTGCPVETFRRRFRRGMKRLSELLEHRCGS